MLKVEVSFPFYFAEELGSPSSPSLAQVLPRPGLLKHGCIQSGPLHLFKNKCT